MLAEACNRSGFEVLAVRCCDKIFPTGKIRTHDVGVPFLFESQPLGWVDLAPRFSTRVQPRRRSLFTCPPPPYRWIVFLTMQCSPLFKEKSKGTDLCGPNTFGTYPWSSGDVDQIPGYLLSSIPYISSGYFVQGPPFGGFLVFLLAFLKGQFPLHRGDAEDI